MSIQIKNIIKWVPVDSGMGASDDKPSHEGNYYLAKIIGKKWAEKFLGGQLYMRNLAEFGIDHLIKPDSQFKNDSQGDIFEGLSGLGITPSSEFFTGYHKALSEKEISPDDIRYGNIDSRYLSENILSLYSLRWDISQSQFQQPSERLLEFGKSGKEVPSPEEELYVVVIHDTFQFLRRLSHTLIESLESPFWLGYGEIDYYDPNDTATDIVRDEFCKSTDYLWQNEFRVVVENLYQDVIISSNATYDNKNGSLTLNMGKLDDIAFMMPIKKFLSLDFTEAQKIAMKPPVPIYALGLPRPKKISFLHPVVKVAGKVFVSKHALQPTSGKRNNDMFVFRQAIAFRRLREAACDITGFLQIADKYFRKYLAVLDKLSGTNSPETQDALNGLIEYIVNLGLSEFGGAIIDKDGLRYIKMDTSDVHDDSCVSIIQKYRKDYLISDAAFLMVHSDEKEWPEYEYKGMKVVRIVPNVNCTLPSGKPVKKGEAVWFSVSKIEWLSHHRDELKLARVRKRITGLHQTIRESEASPTIVSLRSQHRIAEAVELAEHEINTITASLGIKSFEVAKAYAQLADMCMHMPVHAGTGCRAFLSALVCWKELTRASLKDLEISELAALFDNLAQFLAFSMPRDGGTEKLQLMTFSENIHSVAYNLVENSKLSFDCISDELKSVPSIFQSSAAFTQQLSMSKSEKESPQRSASWSAVDMAEFCISITFALCVTIRHDSKRLSFQKRHAMQTLSLIMKQQGRYSEQKNLLLEFLRQSELSGNRDDTTDLMIACQNLGAYYYEHGDHKNALQYLTKGCEICESKALADPARYNSLLAMAYFSLGELHRDEKKTSQAINRYRQACDAFERTKTGPSDKNAYYDKYVDSLLALAREYIKKIIEEARIDMVFSSGQSIRWEIFKAAYECISQAISLCNEMLDKADKFNEETSVYGRKVVSAKIVQAELFFIRDDDGSREKFFYPAMEMAIDICKKILRGHPAAHYRAFYEVLGYIGHLYQSYQFYMLGQHEGDLKKQQYVEQHASALTTLLEHVTNYYMEILNFVIDSVDSGSLDVLLLFPPDIRNITDNGNPEKTGNPVIMNATRFQPVYFVCLQSLCVIYAEANHKDMAQELCQKFTDILNRWKEKLGYFLFQVELKKISEIESLVSGITPIAIVNRS